MHVKIATIAAASALASLLSLGLVSNAAAGHGGYGYKPHYGHPGHGYHRGYGTPGRYGYGGYRRGPMKGYTPYPMYGYPGGAAPACAHGKPHGMHGACGCKKGYMVKTGTGTAGQAAATGDIVEVAAGAGSFNTLVAAVKAADLVDTLKGKGPFTVFAPTDEAFAKIPKADLDALLADKEQLTAVLTYHVVPGKVTAADVTKLDSATTVQGGAISIDASDGVKVNGAKVVKTDIMASNGVIHVIDTVIMPE